MDHILIQSSVEGHHSSFHNLAIVDNAAMNIVVHMALLFTTSVSLGCLLLRKKSPLHNIIMFLAALSTIAKLWKELRCLSTDEWIKKMWSIYNGIFFFKIFFYLFERGRSRLIAEEPDVGLDPIMPRRPEPKADA